MGDEAIFTSIPTPSSLSSMSRRALMEHLLCAGVMLGAPRLWQGSFPPGPCYLGKDREKF